MNRREFLKVSGVVSLSQLWPRIGFASPTIRRVRPSDPSWPSNAAWKRLNEAVGGNLIQVDFPMNACVSSSQSADCKTLFANLKNPYYIGDTPGITQTLGWVDGWATKPSVYAVAARNANDIEPPWILPATTIYASSSKAAATAIRAHRMRPILY